MKLNSNAKLNQNLKLLHSCSQVRIIELTEKIAQLDKAQIELIENSPELHQFLNIVYQTNHLSDKSYIYTPTVAQLAETNLSGYETVKTKEELSKKIPSFEITEKFAEDFKKYAKVYNKKNNLNSILTNFEELNELLEERNIPITKVNTFLNKFGNTKSFKKFADYMKSHSAIRISLHYKQKANEIAERNGIANVAYYSKSNKTFSLKDLSLSLDKEFKGRLYGGIVKGAAALALSATLVGAGFTMGRNSTDTTRGSTTPHTTETTIETTTETPTQKPTISPTTPEEDINIFTSSNPTLTSYETACDAYFQAIEDVYKYNTGKEIDLSGYGQEHIGMNSSAPILVVEYNGQTYRFSGQSQTASNYRHLKEAFDALGANYTETNSRILYIIDKDNSSQSIAIVDSAGNPVRSGNVITGSNRAYNQDYVREGREILVAQVQNASSLSEAECVAAYLLSDEYDIQNPDLSVAQSHFASSTYTIKSTFYERNGKSDPYAVQCFAGDLRDDKEDFEQSILNQKTQTNEQATTDKEHDDR